jgi:hypothetical protein
MSHNRNTKYLDDKRIVYRRNPITDKPTQENECYLFYEEGTYECYSLFSSKAKIDISADFIYEFSPSHYPAKAPFYNGSYKFEKHYYGNNRIEDMKAKGEEFECARAIDTLDEVKYWIRGLKPTGTKSYYKGLKFRLF